MSKAMILAAGLGTRLKPWTLSHPKALVPVGGIPMLSRVMDNLHARGFDDVTVNVHHFADQIRDYLSARYPDAKISDETSLLLDTGGAILHAAPLLDLKERESVLVHNVDILSSAPLEELALSHARSGADITLMVSSRESSRRLLFERDMRLGGWIDTRTGKTKPADLPDRDDLRPLAFSGIYMISGAAIEAMGRIYGEGTPFSIIDFFLHPDHGLDIRGTIMETPDLIDIGKPDTLCRANLVISGDQ
ncbi:MAG: NTP transferase domain-containing protein [Muribaculaceae bacterium]|nr:NTP transferase domain-containing protein [Muribaculaceae bacterium]